MMPFEDWFPPAMVGGTFTILGLLKVYRSRHGVVGGGGKPWKTRLLGSCPSWSKHMNVAITGLFLVIGLSFLSVLAWKLIANLQ